MDHDWNVRPDRIIVDKGIDIDRLGWKSGDYFKLTNINGQPMLIKVDKVQVFTEGHSVNTD